ncbi:MAG: restriction endonuclease, partial [Calditrichaeota bacterium]|nr:restriction endonuclease [Calditrichota bacterium]
RASIDPEVVSQQARESVLGLLNGTRRSGDPQGEAYALLLTEYCRYWNRSMPFMFEREANFTGLLIPANLLADDSFLNRAVKVLNAEICQDVEVIGWLYQFYISDRKDEVFAGFKKSKKAGAEEIPAATQLFTPHWIVRYLVDNSLGRLWMLNRPDSRLAQQMDYYVTPVDDETNFRAINSPEELKIIDPACGSGHMLTYAFDLLYLIY